MRTKKKISLTIDENLYSDFENATKTYNKSKSQLVQETLELWLQEATEKSMAEGYQEMAEEDADFADFTLDAQREIL